MSIQDTASGVALWRQVADGIERGIADGRFAAGEKLPGEMEIAETYRVNRHTVRRALATLAERVAETNFSARQPHRGARHRRLAEIERRAVAADAAADHDQAIFRLAQVFMGRQRNRLEMTGNVRGFGVGQHRHRRLAPDLPVTFLACHHIDLA